MQPRWLVSLRLERVNSTFVADVLEDSVFSLPSKETRTLGTVRVEHRQVTIEVEGGPVASRGFVPGADHVEGRIAIGWRPAALR